MKAELLVTLTRHEFRELISDVIHQKMSTYKSLDEGDDPSRSLISRLEVAKLFGVSKTTIDKWRRSKILPPIIKIASRVYFQKDQILELLVKRQRQPELFTNQ
jgi:predicted DNA-binding transcriptional regulator AlpA